MEKVGVGNILRQRRETLGLTQRDIASFVGVTESAVSRWESGEIGNMRRDKIAKLAEKLEISPLVIMGAENFVDKPTTLSLEQEMLLNCFDDMNQEGKAMTLGLVRSLRVAHPKRKTTPNAVSQNKFGNSGSNIVNVGSSHFKQNISVR